MSVQDVSFELLHLDYISAKFEYQGDWLKVKVKRINVFCMFAWKIKVI